MVRICCTFAFKPKLRLISACNYIREQVNSNLVVKNSLFILKKKIGFVPNINKTIFALPNLKERLSIYKTATYKEL